MKARRRITSNSIVVLFVGAAYSALVVVYGLSGPLGIIAGVFLGMGLVMTFVDLLEG
jgi:F0F1-type ATP synthase assembly protein I